MIPDAAASLLWIGTAEMVTSAPLFSVRGEHLAEVHPIELIAGENQHDFNARLLDVAEVLPHGVGGALVPIGVVERLLGGQNFDEAAVEGVEIVRAADVAVQTDGIELGEQIAAVQTRSDAVRQRDIDQAVLARHGHGRLGTVLGQGIEPGPLPTPQNEGDYISHIIDPENRNKPRILKRT